MPRTAGRALLFALLLVTELAAARSVDLQVHQPARPTAGGGSAALSILANGDFSTGSLAPWVFFSDAAATAGVFGGEARLTIQTVGTNQQLFQAPLPVLGGVAYKIEFDARSSDGSDVALFLIQHGAPFANYGLAQHVNLTAVDRHYSFWFTTTPGNKTDARLQLLLDPSPGTIYWFDNVVLYPLLCGNGVVDPGEECDDGDYDNSDVCLETCRLARCGDGHVRFGVEECDDGNDVAGDGCDPDCTSEPFCGNGVVDSAGEVCDSYGVPAIDCDKDCTPPECGDALLNPYAGEDCDDGNLDADDGCDPTCRWETGFGCEINYAWIDAQQRRLWLHGRNICTAGGPAMADPRVFIGTETGNLFELPIESLTPMAVELDASCLFPLEPATAKVLVECPGLTKTIDVTFPTGGARGPAGPPGVVPPLVRTGCSGDGEGGASCDGSCPTGYRVLSMTCSPDCGSGTMVGLSQEGLGQTAFSCDVDCDGGAFVEVVGQVLCAQVTLATPN